MNKRHKINGKAIKWVNTRFAKPERFRRSRRLIMAAQIAALTSIKVTAMARSSADRATIALGVANCILEGQIAMNKAMELPL